MNQFCEMKGRLRQFSVARTPQQNRFAKYKNRTPIEAFRTMLVDSKLPTNFWPELVNTTCYVQNRVLVVKPHNKTSYELFYGRTLALSFTKPFGCPVTILSTLDRIGKFDGKFDEGFFVGYSMNSKAFRVFNSRKKIVEENLHIRFSKNTLNVIGSVPDWLFDIDALTRTMNYEPIVAGTQSNGFTGTKACDNAGQARKEKEHVDEDLSKESECRDQEQDENVNNTNNVNAVSTNRVNVVSENISNELPFDHNMPFFEDISTFNFSSDHKDDAEEANMNKMDTTIQVSPVPTTRIHKDHPLDQVIRDLHSTTQTRNMSKNLEEHEFVTTIHQRTNHKDLQNYLFTCFLSQEEPKKDERGIVIRNKARLVAQEHTQEEGIDYDEVFASVARIKEIRLFLAYASFKDFVVYQMDVKSAFLYGKIEEEVYVCQPPGFEDLDFFDKVYKVEKALYELHQAPRSWFSKVKNASTPIETQKPLLKDEDSEEVDVHMYRSMISSLMYLTSLRPDIMFVVCAYYALIVNPTVYISCIEQFLTTAKAKPINREVKLQAIGDGKKILITESTVIRDLQLEDAEDKAVYEEMDDSLVRAATTASSLEAEQDNGVNTTKNDDDSLKLKELMELCTNLQNRVLDLETTKTTQALEIDSLKRRVKNLKKKQTSRTQKLKRLYKVGVTARVESSDDNKDLLTREKSQKEEEEANIALTESWDDVQAKINADYQLVERLQAKEQQELNDEEKPTLFMQVLEKRRKFFAAKRAEEKRNKPPIQA
uniref:Uncharacterized protein n=1 Tax=Tanacetum cinerariifolium TaxID=118510 RepID=A0A699HGE1_TANCI|nr:hypothetical protein [Tanacetum cinerariifolium]